MHNLFNTDELKALTGGNDVIQIEINNFGSQGFLAGTRRAGNYCLQECNWGADYSDPETWTDPFTDDNSYNFAYDTTDKYGVNTKTAETLAIHAEYVRLVEEAKKETADMDARYEAFAKAEAYYINHAMVIPYGITGGGYQASKLNTFEGQFATYGQATSRYKGQWIYETAMSEDMYYEQLAAWNAVVSGN
jgi:oligopeptide transport system substrate-binding protein